MVLVMMRMTGAIHTLPLGFCLVLLTMLRPKRNKAEAPKALPKVVKNPSMMDGKVPPKIKFPKIPKMVMKMIGLVLIDLKTFQIKVSLELEVALSCCLPISRKMIPMGLRMTREMGANRYT